MPHSKDSSPPLYLLEERPCAGSTRYQRDPATNELHIPPSNCRSAWASGTFVPPCSAIPQSKRVPQPPWRVGTWYPWSPWNCYTGWCWLFLASVPRIVSPWHNTRNACVTPEVANGFTASGEWSMQHFTRSILGIVFSTGNEKWTN